MVKNKHTKNVYPFELVMERLKRVAGLSTDGKAARALGLSANAFANRKRSNSLPYENLLPFAISRNVNLRALLTGEGSLQGDQESVVRNVEQVDGRLLAEIVNVLEKLDPIEGEKRGDNWQQHLGRHVILAAIIYDKVAYQSRTAVRTSLIRQEADGFIRAREFLNQPVRPKASKSRQN